MLRFTQQTHSTRDSASCRPNLGKNIVGFRDKVTKSMTIRSIVEQYRWEPKVDFATHTEHKGKNRSPPGVSHSSYKFTPLISHSDLGRGYGTWSIQWWLCFVVYSCNPTRYWFQDWYNLWWDRGDSFAVDTTGDLDHYGPVYTGSSSFYGWRAFQPFSTMGTVVRFDGTSMMLHDEGRCQIRIR